MQPNQCDNCGTPIPPDAPAQHCPSCLLQGAIAAATADSPSHWLQQLATRFPQLVVDFTSASPIPGGLSTTATDRQSARKQTVSVLSPSTAPPLADLEKRSKLDHPNISRLRHFGHTDTFAYTITDSVGGERLSVAVQYGRLSRRETLAIHNQLLSALKYAAYNNANLPATPDDITITPDGTPFIDSLHLHAQPRESDLDWIENHTALGIVIDNFRLVDLLGEGGFAEVYLAEQSRPLKRKVALKILKPGMDTEQVAERFEAEQQALARMEHDHIAKVFEAGTTAGGRPYFVMEVADGLPIDEFCSTSDLSLDEKLALFQSICAAVQHAHDRGVIHRDLKPSNILVADVSGRPVPKVIDFGIAKAINEPLTGKTLYTKFYHYVGSPEFMAPEQFSVDEPVDGRCDVYALGCLLFLLITGESPLRLAQLESLPLEDVIRTIRNQPPEKPSDRLAADRPELRTACRRGLDAITCRALAKSPAKRFASPQHLAQAIADFLDTGRFSNRTAIPKWLLATASLAIITLILITALSPRENPATPGPPTDPTTPVSTATARPPFSGKQNLEPVALYHLDDTLESAIPSAPPLSPIGNPPLEFITTDIAGSATSALRVPNLDPTQWLEMPNPIGPNGSAPDTGWTNRYTLVMDVRFPQLDQPVALFQCNPSNANDADAFATPQGITSEKDASAPHGQITRDTWHRLAFVALENGNQLILKPYIDGIPTFLQGHDENYDGRFSLEHALLLFADDSARCPGLDVASVALYDYPLDPESLKLLGRPSPGGIPTSLPIPPHHLSPVSLFQFDLSFNNAIRNAPPMQLVGEVPFSFAQETIGSQTANVLELPALGSSEQLTTANPISPNNLRPLPLTETNDFSLVLDLKFPSLSSDTALFHPSTIAGSALVFAGGDGRIWFDHHGTNAPGGGNIKPDTWHRIALCFGGNQVVRTARFYIDGKRVAGDIPIGAFDGWLSITEGLSVFSDDFARTGQLSVNSIALYDIALSDTEAAALGAPQADGIPYILPLDRPPASFAERASAVHIRAPSTAYLASGEHDATKFLLATDSQGKIREFTRTREQPWTPSTDSFSDLSFPILFAAPQSTSTRECFGLDQTGQLHLLASQPPASKWQASALPLSDLHIHQLRTAIDPQGATVALAVGLDDKLYQARRAAASSSWQAAPLALQGTYKDANFSIHGDGSILVTAIDDANQLVATKVESLGDTPEPSFTIDPNTEFFTTSTLPQPGGGWVIFAITLQGELIQFSAPPSWQPHSIEDRVPLIGANQTELLSRDVQARPWKENGIALFTLTWDYKIAARFRDAQGKWSPWSQPFANATTARGFAICRSSLSSDSIELQASITDNGVGYLTTISTDNPMQGTWQKRTDIADDLRNGKDVFQ